MGDRRSRKGNPTMRFDVFPKIKWDIITQVIPNRKEIHIWRLAGRSGFF